MLKKNVLGTVWDSEMVLTQHMSRQAVTLIILPETNGQSVDCTYAGLMG